MDHLKIPEHQYKGAGWALCVSFGGKVIKTVYLRDASKAFAEVEGSDHDEFFVRQLIGTTDLEKTVNELRAFGEVSIGMCSGGIFTEL